MQRIALISEHASPLATLGGVDSGGQNIYVAQVARHLAELGHQVDIFTRRDNPALPKRVMLSPGVRVVHVNAGPAAFVPKEALLPYMDQFAREVIDFIGTHSMRYHVFHANFFMSGLVAAHVKRALGIPFVVTFHALGRVRKLYQGEADRFPEDRCAIEARVMAAADAIIAECPQDESDLVTLYGADESKIVAIPCGVDVGAFHPVDKRSARIRLGIKPYERVVLQLGRLVPRKGVATAIRGFAELIHVHRMKARLLIVGGESSLPDPRLTPELGRLQKIAEENGVADRVSFLGARGRDVLKDYYCAADVFVSTPWYEPFGITPIEAMACGTPVIGSNVGGIKYTVRDGETGFLVRPRDPQQLGEKLAALLRDRPLRQQFGRNGIARVNRYFTWEKVAARLSALYQRVGAYDSILPRRAGISPNPPFAQLGRRAALNETENTRNEKTSNLF